jgi:hypothetical protein
MITKKRILKFIAPYTDLLFLNETIIGLLVSIMDASSVILVALFLVVAAAFNASYGFAYVVELGFKVFVALGMTRKKII